MKGYGKPPVPYAFILFGSGGRSEQTLWSDQDNGLFMRNSEDAYGRGIRSYFDKLVHRYSSTVWMYLGYPPCEGNVISSNPQWRKSLAWVHGNDDWMV